MKIQDPHYELTRAERDFAGVLIHRGLPKDYTLPAECFRDEHAKEVISAAFALENAGTIVSAQSVHDFLVRENTAGRLRCGIGELVDVASLGDQPDPECLKATVESGYQKRLAERLIRNAINKIENGEDSRVVLTALQSHHQLSFGSIGSFDHGPSESSNPFPLVALGELPGTFAEETSRVGMVPDSLAGASVLGVLSASIGASLRVETYGGKTTGANLFVLPIASSGTGKDSALNLSAEPLNQLDAEWSDRFERETRPDLLVEKRIVDAEIKALESPKKTASVEKIAQTREDSRQLERRRLELESQLEGVPSLMVGDITKEALAVKIAAQSGKALAVVSSEARGILQVIAGRYSSGSDEDIYTGGFSGTLTKVNRLCRPPVVLRNPCLSMLLMVQPDAFQKLSENDAMTESGFLPRCLLFDTKAEPLDVPDSVEPFADSVRWAWDRLIRDLVAMRESEPGIVRPEKGALEMLRAYDNETRKRRRTGGDLRDVSSYAARWPEIAWRIALVIHAVQYRGSSPLVPLSEDTASKAIAIIRWFSHETLNLLEATREARSRKRVERLRELLAGAEGQRMRIRDLAKSHGFDAEELQVIARRVGWLQFGEVQNPNGGRRSPVAIYTTQRA